MPSHKAGRAAKEIKAWCIVCKDSSIHVEEKDDGQDWYLWPVCWPADTQRYWMNQRPKLFTCGPHRVVLLRGEIRKVKVKRRASEVLAAQEGTR